MEAGVILANFRNGRRPLAVLTLVAFALPSAALVADPSAAEESGARIAVVTTDDAMAREAADILSGLSLASGELPVRRLEAKHARDLLLAIERSGAGTLVLAAHSDESGVHVGGGIVPWSDLRDAIHASGASRVALLACDSALAGSIPGVETLVAYEGLVDLEVAALDAAHALALAHLEGESLERFAATHTAYVERNGGPSRFVMLQLFPARPLSGEACAAKWNAWYWRGEGAGGACDTMYVAPTNAKCGRDLACRATLEEQNDVESQVESMTSALVEDESWSYLNSLVGLGAHVCIPSTIAGGGAPEYLLYLSLGRDIRGLNACPENPRRAILASGGEAKCYPIADVTDVVAPYLKGLEEAASRIPGVTLSFNGFEISVCFAIGGGIYEGQWAGAIEGTVEGKGVTGVEASLRIRRDVWFLRVDTEVSFLVEMTMTYPVGIHVDLNYYSTACTVGAYTQFQLGPLSVAFNANLLDINWATTIPFTTYTTKTWYRDWSFCSAAAQAASRSFSLPDVASVAPSAAIVRSEAEARVVLPDGGFAVGISDILELRPGDAFYNHLAKTGALAKLGVPLPVPEGQSVFLDLADETVHETLYGAPYEGPSTIVGLPGGFEVAASTCVPDFRGTSVTLDLASCDATRPIVGWKTTLGTTGLDGNADIEAWVGVAQGSGALATDLVGQATAIACVPLVVDACEWARYESTIEGGTSATAKALDYANVKKVLAREGAFALPVDSCWLSGADFADLPPAHVCMDVHALVPTDASATVLRRVSPSDLALQMEAAREEIMQTAAAMQQEYGANWAANEPVSNEAGALFPDELNPADLVNGPSCGILAALGYRPPDCQ